MLTTSYLMFILGVYGIAWLVVHSALLAPIRDRITNRLAKELLSCIVCTSVWISIFFCFFYYSYEPWFTKILIVGSTTTTTWIIANLIGDLE